MIAGPTELLIYADSKSDPKFVVKDLISQAEHSMIPFVVSLLFQSLWLQN